MYACAMTWLEQIEGNALRDDYTKARNIKIELFVFVWMSNWAK